MSKRRAGTPSTSERPKARARFVEGMTTTTSALTGMAVDVPDNTGTQVVVPRRGLKRVARRPLRGKPLSKKQRFEVNRIINRRSELKFVLTNQAGFGQSSTWTIAKIMTVAQGDADSTRDGDRLQWAGNIELRCNITNGTGTTGDIFNNVRIIIFQWHPNDSTSPLATDILLNGVTGGADTSSHYNHDKRQLYTILFDRYFSTVGNNSSASNPFAPNMQTGLLTYSISLQTAQKSAQYVAAGTTGTNQFYIATCSDSQLATHPSIYYAIKGFFRDI